MRQAVAVCWAAGVVFAIALVALGGCAGREMAAEPTAGLIERVEQWKQADRYRLAALDELEGRGLDAGERGRLGAALGAVLASGKQSPVVRVRAATMVAQRYPQKAGGWISRGLREAGPDWMQMELLGQLGAVGVRGEAAEELAQALVGRSGRGDEVTRGIERALARAGAGTVEESLVAVLAGGETLAGRLAAAGCLKERGRGELAVETAKGLAGAGPVEATLREAAGRFGYVPENLPRFYACRYQQTTLGPGAMAVLARRVGELVRREGYRFRPADGEVLVTAGEALVERPRAELVEEVGAWLAGAEHTKRPGSYTGAADDYREDFLGQVERLDYTDLLRMELLRRALAGGEGAAWLAAIGQAATGDSEVGGLCFTEPAGVRFEAYEPLERRGDKLFVDSPAMLADAAMCLARWHSHPEAAAAGAVGAETGGGGSWRSGAWAGPGLNDLEYVRYFGTPLVVAAPLGGGRWNVDYVTAEGVVIDLGNYGQHST